MKTLTDDKFKEIFPYESPRNNQREIIEKIINAFNSGKRYVILSAPTGTGKSCIGYAVAKYFESGYILTSQKILQEQYYNDFKIPLVLGKNNYTCLKNPNLTCEFGACFNIPKKRCMKITTSGKTVACPYICARDACLSSNFSNINYSYFINATSVPDFLNERGLIVCDEAHNIEDELLKIYTIKISNTILKYIGCLNLKIPNVNESNATKIKWLLIDVFPQLYSQFGYVSKQVQEIGEFKSTPAYKKIFNKFSLLKSLILQISLLNKIVNENQSVIITDSENEIEYKLLHCDLIFKETIEKFSNRFLFMSATILNKKSFIDSIGIDEKLVECIDCDSIFPVENRIIHYKPIGSMSFKSKNNTIPKMIKFIDKILKDNKNVKGIIHTVNYDIAEKIIDGLSFSDQKYRLVMPRGADKQIIMNNFYNSSKPLVLISPSLTEGIDLKEDLSRLCIICKMPYANLGDKWIKARMQESQEWYTNKACTSLVQMTGRSIRSETDFATTYILDSDFVKLAGNGIDIFPEWWQDSVIVD